MRRKSNGKNKDLVLKLKQIIFKYAVSAEDKSQIEDILSKLSGKPGTKIQSEKLNNNKQDNIALAIHSGDSDLSNLNVGHVQSASGIYRRGRIDNKR
jgi:hypothetical protein